MTASAPAVHRRLAHAIKRNAEHSALRHITTSIGTVIDLDPLRVELHDKPHVLVEGDDLFLSGWVRYYDQEIGIKLDDNAVIDLRHGVYTWSDVLSDSDITNGLAGPPTGPAGGDLGGSYPNPSVAHVAGHPASDVVMTGDTRLTNSRTPSGPAGGDLGGTYPNPTVAKIGGATVPASAPSGANLVLESNGAGGTAWTALPAIPTTLPPSGAAGGSLAGTYPNPSLVAAVWHNVAGYFTGTGTGGWADYNTAAWPGLQYTVDGLGFAHLRGAVKNTSAVVYPSTNVKVATLPSAIWPALFVRVEARYIDTNIGHGETYAYIDHTNGVVTLGGLDFGNNGNNNGLYSPLWINGIWIPGT